MEMDFPTLAGPRISLRRVEADSPADVEAMHRCYQCPEVHRYTQGRAFRLEEWPEIIRGWEMERQKSGFIRWGIALTGDGALIGGIYLYRNDGKVFLGYLLHPAYWGNGYAFEAVNLVKRYAFTEWNIKALHASVDRRNFASIRLLKRSDFCCLESQPDEEIYVCNHFYEQA